MSDPKERNLIMAIETSGQVCSVSLAEFSSSNIDKVNIICEYTMNESNRHDKFCAELCKRILNDNNIVLPYDLFAVAVSIGPGSFTGLRIGVSIAKGLCFDEHIKLVAVPTMNALALSAKKSLEHSVSNKETDTTNIITVIPSHSTLYYCQRFTINNFVAISECKLTEIDEIITLSKQNNSIIVSNQRIDLLSENAKKHYPTALQSISSAAIAKYSILQIKRNDFADPYVLVPLYIQDFEVKTR